MTARGAAIVWCANSLRPAVWNEPGGDLVGVDGASWYETRSSKITEWTGVLDRTARGNPAPIADGTDGMTFRPAPRMVLV